MAEAAVGILNQTGKNVRTVEVTTLINGVPTVVEMQVMAIADAAGNVIDDFADYRFQRQVIEELQQIRQLLGSAYGLATFAFPATQ